MKSRPVRSIILFLVLASFLFPQEKMRIKDLPQKYRDFLNLTTYIMHSKEKNAFLELTNDRERDAFIEMFWRIRDPTSGTAENEYKDEHIKRFMYANRQFRRGSPREGWMTDQGKFYIILGPPVSIDRYPSSAGLYPCEVWSYYGESEKRLPPHFVLVFFQRSGSGEYKLYDPVSDGPASLLVRGGDYAHEDYKALHKKIQELAPALATASLSLIPGEIPYGFRPSPRNTILMANIVESPKRNVNTSYATHFLSLRGVVSTEHMTNIVESETITALIPDPIVGINFVHFSMVPQTISVDYYEQNDQYFCNFTLNVSLRVEDDIVFQYTKEFPLYFNPEDLDRIRANGISIEDSFPVVEGKFKLTILLQNSIGKEFSIFEREISVLESSGSPQIVGPFFGYGFQDYQSNIHIPFKIVSKKLIVDPKNTFSSRDEVSFLFDVVNVSQSLWKDGQIRVLINGLKKKDPVHKSLTLKLSDYPYNEIMNIPHSIPAKEFSPDYYEMRVQLVSKDEETIDEKKKEFIISPEEALSHPITRAKIFPHSDNFLLFYMRAHQYKKLNDLEKAEAAYEKAFSLKPDYKKGLIEYANFLFGVKKFDKSLELIESIKDDDQLRFDYYLVKGRALMGMEEFKEAIDNLIKGNQIYNSDTGLLNSLGICYYRTGQKERALEVLRASLNLNSAQKDVKRLIEEIEKSKDSTISGRPHKAFSE